MANYKRSGGNGIALKIYAAITSILVAASAVVMGVGFGTGRWQIAPKDEPAQEQPDEEAGGAVIGEGEANGISLTSAKIATADYDEYGISPLAETAYTIIITPEPADAIDTYTWTCDNNQQIQLSPNENTKSCSVSITGPFATQATITISSNMNSDVKATVTVDYVKRITAVTVSNTSVKFGGDSAQSNTITLTPTYGTGTITPELTVTGGTLEYNISPTTSVSNSVGMTSTILSVDHYNYSFTGNSLSLTTPYDFFVVDTTTSHMGVGGIYPGAPSESQLANAFNNSFINSCNNNSSDADLTVNYTYSYTVGENQVGGLDESGSTTIGIGLDVSALATYASNISPNYGGIVA